MYCAVFTIRVKRHSPLAMPGQFRRWPCRIIGPQAGWPTIGVPCALKKPCRKSAGATRHFAHQNWRWPGSVKPLKFRTNKLSSQDAHPATSRFHHFSSGSSPPANNGQLKSVPPLLCFCRSVFAGGKRRRGPMCPAAARNGANVTLSDNGSTVTMANGIVSIVMHQVGRDDQPRSITPTTTAAARRRLNLLVAAATDGGKFYWENSGNRGLTFTYSLVADPATNGGNYAEIALSPPRSPTISWRCIIRCCAARPAFTSRAIWIHRSTDGAFGMGECRDNIYAGSIFNWMSVDAHAQPGDGSFRRLGHRRAGRAGGSLAVDERDLRRPIRGQIQIQRRPRRAARLGLEQRGHRRQEHRLVEHLRQL